VGADNLTSNAFWYVFTTIDVTVVTKCRSSNRLDHFANHFGNPFISRGVADKY
jgi:hypothetical protein